MRKKNKPIVSIIMNCYNGEKYLIQSLTSVISQTFKNWEVIIPALGLIEIDRAQSISGGRATILADTSIKNLMRELSECSAAVSVDTGLGHLANAFSVPSIGIFGRTDPKLTGLVSPTANLKTSINLRCSCAKCSYQEKSNHKDYDFPCYEEVTPERVWIALEKVV